MAAADFQFKATATEQLTARYVQKLSRENYLAAAVTIFITTISLLWMFVKPGGHEATIFYGDSLYAVANWIAAFWVLRIVYRATRGPVLLDKKYRRAWLFIGIGLIANGIGGAWYTYLEMSGNINPVPSPADIGFTLYYVLTFIGLLFLPVAIKIDRARFRIGLDALIITLCALAYSWYILIQPIVSHVHDLYTLLVSDSYPFWDLLLVLALLLIAFQRVGRLLIPSLFLFAAGILSQIWADSFYAATLPFNSYTTGTWYIDTFWFLGALLMGLAAQFQYATIARRIYSEHTYGTQERERNEYNLSKDARKTGRMSLQGILIFLTVLFIVGLVLYCFATQTLSLFVLSLACCIGILIGARILIINTENEMLLAEQERQRAEAELLRRMAAQLMDEIHLDSLLTRIVTLATTELRYDAAALLLIEDYDHPLDSQSSLYIRATPSSGRESATWRLEGEHLPQCTVLKGKQVDVIWAEQDIDLPKEVQQWHNEQHISRTLFVPLVYQGKIQGTLGLSQRAVTAGTPQAIYLANTFAEQAAIAIEHARLYETAHEHELFAQALTTVAARLNSAVATGCGIGTDIHQLVCTEAARALQADYAILYIPGENGNLHPVATHFSQQETPVQVSDWPPIRSREFEAQAITSLQPTLIEIDDSMASGPLPIVSGKIPALLLSSTQPQQTQPVRVSTKGLRDRRTLTLREALVRRHVQTAILAPLVAGNAPIALLVLARAIRRGAGHKRSYLVSDLPQAQDFAEQASTAFTNAQLYQQLRDAHRQLQELDQLKDQFMITASHELRTPLTAVQGYLELLAQFGDAIPPEQQQEFLQKARRGCDELVLLLSNVMDASRLEIEAGIRPAHLQRVPVKDIVEQVYTLIEPQMVQEQREVFFYVPNQLFVRADPARLKQVLLNLSSNALKYSPPGTPISYAARTAYDQIPSVIISVADRGKGIKQQDQAQLFQRFVRLERDLNSPVRGSGLGLYISRRLIEAMGGKIWMESSGIPGTGSTFHIELPLA